MFPDYLVKSYSACDFHITFAPEDDDAGLLDKMKVDIVMWACKNPLPANMFIVSKSYGNETLECGKALSVRGYCIVVSDRSPEKEIKSLWSESLLRLCEKLSDTTDYGNKRKRKYDSEDFHQIAPPLPLCKIENSPSFVEFMLDDSFEFKRSRESGDSERFVFWDVEDPSILAKINPMATARTIKTALCKKGHVGHVSIWGFVDLYTDHDVCAFSRGGILLEQVVEGGKTERFNSMALTIMLWAMDKEPGCALVLSRDEGFKPIVDTLKSMHFQAGLFDPLVFLSFGKGDSDDQCAFRL